MAAWVEIRKTNSKKKKPQKKSVFKLEFEFWRFPPTERCIHQVPRSADVLRVDHHRHGRPGLHRLGLSGGGRGPQAKKQPIKGTTHRGWALSQTVITKQRKAVLWLNQKFIWIIGLLVGMVTWNSCNKSVVSASELKTCAAACEFSLSLILL